MKAVTRAAEEPRPVLCAWVRGTRKSMKRGEVDVVEEGWQEGLCE